MEVKTSATPTRPETDARYQSAGWVFGVHLAERAFMTYERDGALDRVFARRAARLDRLRVADAWTPPWRPRGRWWMRPRLPRGYRDLAASAARGWRQAARQPHAC